MDVKRKIKFTQNKGHNPKKIKCRREMFGKSKNHKNEIYYIKIKKSTFKNYLIQKFRKHDDSKTYSLPASKVEYSFKNYSSKSVQYN